MKLTTGAGCERCTIAIDFPHALRVTIACEGVRVHERECVCVC